MDCILMFELLIIHGDRSGQHIGHCDKYNGWEQYEQDASLRCVFTLKNDIEIDSGEGTSESPYYLK